MAAVGQIQDVFGVFWTFVQQNTPGLLVPDPLHRVRENWKTWWDGELDAATRTGIEQLVLYLSPSAEMEFCLHVARFFGGSASNDDTGGWVLCQLAQCAPFEEAHRLRAYHPSQVEGPHAVFLASRSRDDLHALKVYLIERPPGDWPPFVFLNLHIHDQGALKRLSEGVSHFLRPLPRIAFCIRAAFTNAAALRVWNYCLLAAAVFFLLFCLLLCLVDPYGDQETFETLLQGWGVAWPVLAVILCAALARLAFSSSSPQPALFVRKQVCVAASGIAGGDVLELEGPSFGLPLAMALLAAIFRRSRCAMEQILQSASFAQGVYTGQVDEHARVLPVALLRQKLGVWQEARAALPLFLVPEGQPIEIPKVQPARPAPLTAMAAGASGVAACRNLSDAVFASAGMRYHFHWPIVLALSVLLASGIFWLRTAWLLNASRVEATATEVYVSSTNDPVHGSELMLHLCVSEIVPPPAVLYRWLNADSLAIRLNSDTFRNVYARVADFRVGRSCELHVPLKALSLSGRAPSAVTDLDIRVVQARSFWFSIPERVLVHTRLPIIQTGGDRL